MKRECGKCTACCEGWLSGNINGEEMYVGKKCRHICATGCAIYEKRPQEPCRNFSCVWLKNNSLPDWLQPILSGVIIKEERWGESKDKIFCTRKCSNVVY